MCITGTTMMDMVRVTALMVGTRRADRPELPGIITPGRCKIGIMPAPFERGKVRVISYSGTRTYQAVAIDVAVSVQLWHHSQEDDAEKAWKNC